MTRALSRTRTADPLLTIRIAAVCARSAPLMLHVARNEKAPTCGLLQSPLTDSNRRPLLTVSRRTHPCRLDVFGKTEAAGQRGVGEEGELVDLVAAQGEDQHAPGLRPWVVAE